MRNLTFMKTITIILVLLSLDCIGQKQIFREDSLRNLAYRNVRAIKMTLDSSFILISFDQHGNAFPAKTVKCILSYDNANNLVKAERIFSSADSFAYFYFNQGDFLFAECGNSSDVYTTWGLWDAHAYLNEETNLEKAILQNIRKKQKK